MNRYQKEVERQLLQHEKEVRKQLTETYTEALAEVKQKLKKLQQDPENQSKIMQAKYQKQLEAQLEDILGRLGQTNVAEVQDYLKKMYEDGYLGCLYGMHKDGVELLLMVPEDQVERVIRMETEDLNFSDRIYRDTAKLRKDFKAEMSRGLATGSHYNEIARQLSLVSEASLKQAFRIVQTEGHRVQNESKYDCMHDARDKGADVVKQWDSTVDSRTRETHRELDGQIRELDAPFEVDGKKAMYPGGFGIASEDIHCRCTMLQRARWALSDTEYKYSKLAGEIISTKSDTYTEWKDEYKKSVNHDIMNPKKAHRTENYKFSSEKRERKAKVYTDGKGVKYVYPDQYDKEQQSVSPEMAMEVFEKVPEGLSKYVSTLEFVDYQNPADQYWEQVYGIKGFVSEASGGNNNITVYGNGPGYYTKGSLLETLAHESGHILDQEYQKEFGVRLSDTAEWKEAIQKDLKISQDQYTSDYAQETGSLLEDFADAVSQYVCDTDYFRTLFPNRTEIIKKILEEL